MARPTAVRHALQQSRRVSVMGILNVTPDSFSDGGFFDSPRKAVAHGLRLVEEGADMLDVGGQSTRPGASAVSAKEELRRVIPVIEKLASRVAVPISIDTAKAQVAAEAVAAGACLINDVTALRGDRRMAEVAARSQVPVVLMHMRGTPRTMQSNPRYRNVVAEVAAFLKKQMAFAQRFGIPRSHLMVDPGLGFGKTVAHNLKLMQHLDAFVGLGVPVVVGASRKSFIGKVLDAKVGSRLSGSLACAAYAHFLGARIVRVHDVKETVQLLKMLESIKLGRA